MEEYEAAMKSSEFDDDHDQIAKLLALSDSSDYDGVIEEHDERKDSSSDTLEMRTTVPPFVSHQSAEDTNLRDIVSKPDLEEHQSSDETKIESYDEDKDSSTTLTKSSYNENMAKPSESVAVAWEKSSSLEEEKDLITESATALHSPMLFQQNMLEDESSENDEADLVVLTPGRFTYSPFFSAIASKHPMHSKFDFICVGNRVVMVLRKNH